MGNTSSGSLDVAFSHLFIVIMSEGPTVASEPVSFQRRDNSSDRLRRRRICNTEDTVQANLHRCLKARACLDSGYSTVKVAKSWVSNTGMRFFELVTSLGGD